MKKLIALAVALLCFAAVASAQPKAIGIRGTYGAELSYQHYTGPGFWEFDAGLFNKMLDVCAIYDFIIAPMGQLNLYAGPGAYVAMWPQDKDGLLLNAGAVGQIGLEYNFNITLQISLDWRPCFNFVNSFGWSPYGIALGIRYAF